MRGGAISFPKAQLAVKMFESATGLTRKCVNKQAKNKNEKRKTRKKK